jgi:superfamily II RNA helicase
MVLNMLRVEDADPENLLKSSFYQYQVRPSKNRSKHHLSALKLQLFYLPDNTHSHPH